MYSTANAHSSVVVIRGGKVTAFGLHKKLLVELLHAVNLTSRTNNADYIFFFFFLEIWRRAVYYELSVAASYNAEATVVIKLSSVETIGKVNKLGA